MSLHTTTYIALVPTGIAGEGKAILESASTNRREARRLAVAFMNKCCPDWAQTRRTQFVADEFPLLAVDSNTHTATVIAAPQE